EIRVLKKLASLAELCVETAPAATTEVAPESDTRSVPNGATETGDQAVADENEALDDGLRQRGAASGIAVRASASARSADVERGPGAVAGPPALRCGVCGRPGRFVRAGPLRRLRLRQRDGALRGRPSIRAGVRAVWGPFVISTSSC